MLGNPLAAENFFPHIQNLAVKTGLVIGIFFDVEEDMKVDPSLFGEDILFVGALLLIIPLCQDGG